MDWNLTAILGLIGLTGGGIGVWVSLRERLARAETKIDGLETQHREQKSEFQQLREFLETQFNILRRDIARKVDRDK